MALITGAAQGIGRGRALRRAKDGADIAIVDAVAAEIKELGRKVTTFKADVSNRADVYAAVDHAEKTLGGFAIMASQMRAFFDTLGGIWAKVGWRAGRFRR